MSNKIILRLSNNIGNQMFMYAAAYSFAKQLNRELYIDEESSFNSKNKIHKYELDSFNFTSKIAPVNYKFLYLKGNLKRKLLKKINSFKRTKNFYIEHRNHQKITFYNNDFLKDNYSQKLFIEGHFESEKYFSNFKKDINNEFTFKFKDLYIKNELFKLINNSNSVSICLRQNRFSEKFRKISYFDKKKSETFALEQIKYIKKSIDILKTKLQNPKFFIWTNDSTNLEEHFPKNQFTIINNNQSGLDLFLMTQAKHYIVIPSSFNWWGCWLSNHTNKIVFRPSNNFFSEFKLNNRDFWPDSWKVID